MICSKALADEADRVHKNGKEFAYDHVIGDEVVTLKKKRRSTVEHSGQSTAPIAQGNPSLH